ncbi:hypothetical protein OH799_33070 [Nocardia sp. NBC_00881]|uniref:hypothetical protein n=1 Tax=Nocardia sp. NBC_00881 TaxID=2975995 RepID=UPI00386B2E34|nr:hypothetical protein OH799_33070 [Nocardia sp. NBC_00881]
MPSETREGCSPARLPRWLEPSLPLLGSLTDEQAFVAVRGIRAISWKWRFWSVVRRPRLLGGLGRRHYGVAAQDVDDQLSEAIPGIVVCSHGTRCPRHSGVGGECTGRLQVHYELVVLVVLAAARHLNKNENRVDALSNVPRVPSHAVQNYCYHTIAAIHRAAGQGGDV